MSNYFRKYLVVFSSVTFLVAGSAPLVRAQSPNPPGGGTGTPIPSFFSVCSGSGANGGFLCVLNKILDTLVLIAAPVLAILIVIGGIQIMTAAGNPEKITKGRQTILYAVGGYAIILLASSVVPVLKSLLGP